MIFESAGHKWDHGHIICVSQFLTLSTAIYSVSTKKVLLPGLFISNVSLCRGFISYHNKHKLMTFNSQDFLLNPYFLRLGALS